MKTDVIRTKYIEFFQRKGHKLFASDSLVPDDPTVLFTSAGMNQFKPYFLGEKNDTDRATSHQKCLRTGDIEEVGKTPFHHTFFEMLGNFSFGDYFKEQAIVLAWEFLTEELKIDKDFLWVSVYKDDDEAYEIWLKKIGILPRRIVRLGEESNFWPARAPSLGPDGPCGPCSEIFYDRGKDKGCQKEECSPACDCGRFVEIWNLVFTQFNRVGENKLEPLPQKNIDTGMGLERMASVLQGKYSNYEIDILAPVVDKVKEKLKIDGNDHAFAGKINAIVDHARAATFSIADGVYPSNEERGYVVRKIIRRALVMAKQLNYSKPLLYSLVDSFVDFMGHVYSEIKEKKDVISKVIKAEEEQFLSIYDEGKSYLIEQINRLKKNQKKVIEASELFKLHDTYGFSLELSKDIAEKNGFLVDEKGFGDLLAEQRNRSRSKSMFDETIFKKDSLVLSEKTEFVGYDEFSAEAEIIRIFESEKEVESVSEKAAATVILDKTPFYAEGGGQRTDTGEISTSTGKFQVVSVLKVADAYFHKGIVTSGKISKGPVSAVIDRNRRQALARAHTATHLLQAALRESLGAHVVQQGSLVDVDRLRFDFTHFKGLTQLELNKIEKTVNALILNPLAVEKTTLTLEQAKSQGALAFFKEKYSDSVRMVSIADCSKELCGGTHLNSTAEVGLFIIVDESSISSGVRRIEAVVGRAAYDHFSKTKNELEEINRVLKSSGSDTVSCLNKILDDYKKEKENNERLNRKLLSQSVSEIIEQSQSIGDNLFLVYRCDGKKYPELLYLSDLLGKKEPQTIVFLYSCVDGKDVFVLSVTEEIVKKGFSCKKFIAACGSRLSLKGGGRDTLVQGVFLAKPDKNFQTELIKMINDFLNQ
ncbi:MAG: alanine--tRNA ligase [Candidatus Omnitrophica bacterium]|nr:alanine--tRNA ligase [Candidatus Omnitrophota bacterium]